MAGRSAMRHLVIHLLVAGVASVTLQQDPGEAYGLTGPEEVGPPVPGVAEFFRANLTAAMSVHFRGPEPTVCSQEERDVLVPVDVLTRRIVGKVNVQGTYTPESAPKACKFTPNRDMLKGCYKAWGFSDQLAGCWAQEASAKASECGQLCLDWLGKRDLSKPGCNKCLTAQRQKRRNCQWFSMRISKPCRACQAKAYHYFDTACSIACREAFETGSLAVSSPQCRKCNTVEEDMLTACGAQ